MRLIDADDFKEKIKGVCDAGGWLEPVTTAIKEYICKNVDYQTTVDAIEVVRCKDCKHRVVNENYGDRGYLSIKAMCELDTGDPFDFGRDAEDDNWFCKDGERKTDA